MPVFYLALSAFGGGIVAALLGWYASGEEFQDRKFIPSLLRALIAAGIVAISYPFIDTLGLWPGIIAAFLAGAGVDVLGHKAIGAIKK